MRSSGLSHDGGTDIRSTAPTRLSFTTSARLPTPALPRLRKLVSGELYVGWLAVVMFHLYLCFSTSVSSTTLSMTSPAMSSAALRSSSFLWATSTRAACQADQ